MSLKPLNSHLNRINLRWENSKRSDFSIFWSDFYDFWSDFFLLSCSPLWINSSSGQNLPKFPQKTFKSVGFPVFWLLLEKQKPSNPLIDGGLFFRLIHIFLFVTIVNPNQAIYLLCREPMTNAARDGGSDGCKLAICVVGAFLSWYLFE